MSETLSDGEIRELRRLQKEVDEDVHHIDNGAENARDAAAGEALTRLLDEVERWRKMIQGIAKPLSKSGGSVRIHVGPPPGMKPIKG